MGIRGGISFGCPFPPAEGFWVGGVAGGVPNAPPSRPASWMEGCLSEELPPPTELEENLRNGVLLAKLGHCFAPAVVPLKKIYDRQQTRYKVRLWCWGRGSWGGVCSSGRAPKLAGTFPSAGECEVWGRGGRGRGG